MAGGKETPRQKMIGMMYLVLTALLALNVSKEIINAFVKLDSKLMENNKVLIDKSDNIMSDFDQRRAAELLGKIKENDSKVIPWQKKAMEVRKLIFETDKFLNIDCKNKMLNEVEGKDFVTADEKNMRFITSSLMDVQSKDDYDAATRLFGGEPGSEGFNNGAEIRNKIHSLRDQLMKTVAEYEYAGKKYNYNPQNVSDSASLEKELAANVYSEDRDRMRAIYGTLTLPEKLKDYEEEVDWQIGTFDHSPVVAAAALFTALSNDVRMSEVQALEILLSRVKVQPYHVNKIEPMSFARSGYLNVGDSMDINILVAAWDTNDVPKIRYGVNDSIKSNWKEITGKLPVKATQPGEYNVYGEISVKENGIEKWKPFHYYYEVGAPSGTVSNEDLTIIYAGYDHTFSAAASGFPQEDISLNVSGAIVTPLGGGKFKVRMDGRQIGQKIASSITARSEKGNQTLKGPTFLVKKLPKPQLFYGDLSSDAGTVTVSQIISGSLVGLRANYDESIPLDRSKIRFSVSNCKMRITINGNPVTFNLANGKPDASQQQTMRNLRSGMTVTFTADATGPTGPMRVAPITFIIK